MKKEEQTKKTTLVHNLAVAFQKNALDAELEKITPGELGNLIPFVENCYQEATRKVSYAPTTLKKIKEPNNLQLGTEEFIKNLLSKEVLGIIRAGLKRQKVINQGRKIERTKEYQKNSR